MNMYTCDSKSKGNTTGMIHVGVQTALPLTGGTAPPTFVRRGDQTAVIFLLELPLEGV